MDSPSAEIRYATEIAMFSVQEARDKQSGNKGDREKIAAEMLCDNAAMILNGGYIDHDEDVDVAFAVFVRTPKVVELEDELKKPLDDINTYKVDSLVRQITGYGDEAVKNTITRLINIQMGLNVSIDEVDE